jgi:hypothetical protein
MEEREIEDLSLRSGNLNTQFSKKENLDLKK